MKHLFVPYELAVKLKEVGFDENCFGGFDAYKELRFDYIGYVNNSDFSMPPRNHTAAPLYQQVVDWLWDKHMIFISPTRESLGSDEWEFGYHIEWLPKDCWELKRRGTSFQYKNSYTESPGGTYYGAWATINEALTNAIEAALKLINQ